MKIKNFIKAIWELPQTVLGYIVKALFKAKPIGIYADAIVYSWNISGGMSLGKFIFVPFTKVNPKSNTVMYYIKHEYGHSIQSKKLGWLYLLVIGIPSLVWARCFNKYRIKTGKSYYDFYTEKWANKLGGVSEVSK